MTLVSSKATELAHKLMVTRAEMGKEPTEHSLISVNANLAFNAATHIAAHVVMASDSGIALRNDVEVADEVQDAGAFILAIQSKDFDGARLLYNGASMARRCALVAEMARVAAIMTLHVWRGVVTIDVNGNYSLAVDEGKTVVIPEQDKATFLKGDDEGDIPLSTLAPTHSRVGNGPEIPLNPVTGGGSSEIVLQSDDKELRQALRDLSRVELDFYRKGQKPPVRMRQLGKLAEVVEEILDEHGPRGVEVVCDLFNLLDFPIMTSTMGEFGEAISEHVKGTGEGKS